VGRIHKGGRVSFVHEYERLLPNGEYAYPLLKITATVTDYDPGVLSGPPENCYPPEGGDVEDLTVHWPDDRLWEDPPEELLERLDELAREQWINAQCEEDY
jgi:hypothetical protein